MTVMRIHIVAAVFPPEPLTSAWTSGDIAGEMTRRGHDVTVFTSFPNRPSGVMMDGYRRSARRVEHRNGYKIVRTWHTLSKTSTIPSRFSENISLGITSTLAMMREPAADVVYLAARPIFAKWLGAFLANRRDVPIVCSVKDLYPETFVYSVGASSGNPIFRLLRFLDKWTYDRSSLITALNRTQADYMIADRGLPPEKVAVFQDWVDASQFPENDVRDGPFRKKHGYSTDQFLAMYVGSLTRMAGLDLYIEAAEQLRHRKDIRLVLVGDGAMRGDMESAIAARDLDNIDVIYPLTPDQVPDVQAAADVLLLSLLPGAAAHTTPSKLVFYMFSGRPVLASIEAEGPPASIIRGAEIGHVVDQGDARRFAAQLIEMADEKASLITMGSNARRYALANFSRDNVLPAICDAIEEVARHS